MTPTSKLRADFTLDLRIPGWVRNQPAPSNLYRYNDGLKPHFSLHVNGVLQQPNLVDGDVPINRVWRPGDTVTLDLDMPIRRVVANPAVKAERDRFALERGPLVYCAEGADNGGKVLDKVFAGKIAVRSQERPDLFGGIIAIQAAASESGAGLTCIPYCLRCNRGPNEMRVWFPTRQ